jgi:hypothetical protein
LSEIQTFRSFSSDRHTSHCLTMDEVARTSIERLNASCIDSKHLPVTQCSFPTTPV